MKLFNGKNSFGLLMLISLLVVNNSAFAAETLSLTNGCHEVMPGKSDTGVLFKKSPDNEKTKILSAVIKDDTSKKQITISSAKSSCFYAVKTKHSYCLSSTGDPNVLSMVTAEPSSSSSVSACK